MGLVGVLVESAVMGCEDGAAAEADRAAAVADGVADVDRAADGGDGDIAAMIAGDKAWMADGDMADIAVGDIGPGMTRLLLTTTIGSAPGWDSLSQHRTLHAMAEPHMRLISSMSPVIMNRICRPKALPQYTINV